MNGKVSAKREYLVKLLQADSDLKCSELAKKVKAKFGKGIPGGVIREARLIVNPDYRGRPRKNPQDGPTRKSFKNLSIKKILRAGEREGVAKNVMEKVLAKAFGKDTSVNPELIKIPKRVLERVKAQLSQYRRSCITLTSGMNVVIVRQDRFRVSERRGKHSEK